MLPAATADPRMSIDPFSAAAPGFDDPLGVLQACHRRIERQLDTLVRLLAHLPQNHADADARAAARAILRYFDTAAVNHHADEEESLFPRLRSAGGQLLDDIKFLEREHVRLDARWRRLRPLLAAIACGTGAHLPPAEVHSLCAAYAAHIAREDGRVFPEAARLLDTATLAAIGAEMAARRGIASGTGAGLSEA